MNPRLAGHLVRTHQADLHQTPAGAAGPALPRANLPARGGALCGDFAVRPLRGMSGEGGTGQAEPRGGRGGGGASERGRASGGRTPRPGRALAIVARHSRLLPSDTRGLPASPTSVARRRLTALAPPISSPHLCAGPRVLSRPCAPLATGRRPAYRSARRYRRRPAVNRDAFPDEPRAYDRPHDSATALIRAAPGDAPARLPGDKGQLPGVKRAIDAAALR